MMKEMAIHKIFSFTVASPSNNCIKWRHKTATVRTSRESCYRTLSRLQWQGMCQNWALLLSNVTFACLLVFLVFTRPSSVYSKVQRCKSGQFEAISCPEEGARLSVYSADGGPAWHVFPGHDLQLPMTLTGVLKKLWRCHKRWERKISLRLSQNCN